MRLATKSDWRLVSDIITQTMCHNRGVCWMLRSDHMRHLKNLALYAFYKALDKKGAYISNNQKGIALCFQFNSPQKSLRPLFYKLIFLIQSIRITNIPAILKLEAYKKKRRPSDGNYLYFWFFCVAKGGDDAGFELKRAIYEKANKEHLTIYAETSSRRNKMVYERLGFTTYHYYKDEKHKLEFWFMMHNSSTTEQSETPSPNEKLHRQIV